MAGFKFRSLYLQAAAVVRGDDSTAPGNCIYGSTSLVGLCLLIIEDSRCTLRHTILGRTPLDESSARRRDLYLTTYPPAGFEPAIPTSERPQTHVLARAATVIINCIPQLAFNSFRTIQFYLKFEHDIKLTVKLKSIISYNINYYEQ